MTKKITGTRTMLTHASRSTSSRAWAKRAALHPSLSFFLPLALSLLKPLHRSYLKVHGQCVQVCLVIEHARRVTHPYFPQVKSGVGPTQSEPPQKKLARRENVSVRGRDCSFL